MTTTSYRYPNEQLLLGITILLVFGVIAISATLTVCTSVIVILGFVLISYFFSQSHHRELLHSAYPLDAQQMPGLARLFRQAMARLQPGKVQVYIVPSSQMNAYTFGLDTPKVVVLYSTLVKAMDEAELTFVVGHELGHVALGHTWLNSLVGGLAGLPTSWSVGVVLSASFLWWNRACEYSADRAGLLACGQLDKAISALIKVTAGAKVHSSHDLERAYQLIDAQDDTIWGNLEEALSSHPLTIRRIQELRRYASSTAYRRLQAAMQKAAG